MLNKEHVESWKMGVLPTLLTEYCLKAVFNTDVCGLFSPHSQAKHMFSKVKAAMGIRGVKIELLCLYV